MSANKNLVKKITYMHSGAPYTYFKILLMGYVFLQMPRGVKQIHVLIFSRFLYEEIQHWLKQKQPAFKRNSFISFLIFYLIFNILFFI